VIGAGFLPPLADGFRQFVAAPTAAAVASRSVEEALAASDEDPYDTHPPLKERVQALEAFPDQPATSGEPPAIDLLAGVPQRERNLMRPWADTAPRPLASITWEDVGPKSTRQCGPRSGRVTRGSYPRSPSRSSRSGSPPARAAGAGRARAARRLLTGGVGHGGGLESRRDAG
jgi:hypothetical protein